MSAIVVDAGNTRIKWAPAMDGRLTGPSSAIARAGSLRQDAEAVARAWSDLREPPHRVLAASAGDAGLIDALSEWARAAWSVSVEAVVAREEAFGIRNGYARPERLGADRWLALVAAHRIAAGADCIVVDCGTAITVDALRGDGRHLGGLILPGLAMMRRALTTGTRGVRVDDADGGAQAVGPLAPHATDTAAAVHAGTSWAAVGALDRIVGALRADLTEPVCLITGGDAGAIQPLLDVPYRLEPDLVLAGLAIVAGEREA